MEKFGLTNDNKLILCPPCTTIMCEALEKSIIQETKNEDFPIKVEGELVFIKSISEIIPCFVLARKAK